MRLANWLIALALLPSSACLVDNPRNCTINADMCAQFERCNMETQRCESVDCSINAAACTSTEYCDGLSKRCMPRDCLLDATLCSATQDCNSTTRQCQTRSFVLGQPDAMTNLNAAYGMSGPVAVLLVPDPAGGGRTKLIVADAGNSRVLIWNDIPPANRPADAVIGAPDVNTLNNGQAYGGVNERSLAQPLTVTGDGTRLVISDQFLHRMLIFNNTPTMPSSAEPIPANQEWGQPDFVSSSINAGADTPNALGVDGPLAYLERLSTGGSGIFAVSDRLNNRVLVFQSGVPAMPQQAPSAILGQPDAMSNLAGVSQSMLKDPRGIASDGSAIYVADLGNNRIVTFPYTPTTGAMAQASPLFGQPSFTMNAANQGGLGPSSLFSPHSLSIPPVAGPKKMWVADLNNNRLLRYALPSTMAELVLGQANFTSGMRNHGTGMVTADSLSQPFSVSAEGTYVAVADTSNNRVLLWDDPMTNGQPADLVLGQPNFTSNTINTPPNRSALQYQGPSDVATDGTHLAVADAGNNRVLFWNKIPQNGTTMPDVILGQADGVQNAVNRGTTVGPTTLSGPQGVSITNGQLVVADTGNNRLLIWQQFPTQNAAPADTVVGQPGFTTNGFRGPLMGVSSPQAAVLEQGKLYVADTGYNRVLIFNDAFAANALPNVVIGQMNMMGATANCGGPISDKVLFAPRSLAVANGKLLVVDRSNNRVLIWNTPPTTNFAPADVVVGQTDFTANYTRTDRTRFASPRSVFVYQNRLYVSSTTQNRILYWNTIPTENGARADGVLGQSDFSSAFPNNPDVAPVEKLSAPAGMAAAADQLFIADGVNHRVSVRAVPSS